MDDLYGNLENYNEVNALEELRSENKELKDKLEEYASSMDKLQKDFDKLTSEFKKLEYNYSSLLKTARAEIERKTQIITNINIEKDVLIIKALQNGNRHVLNYKSNMSASKPNLAKYHKSDIDKCSVLKPQTQEKQNCDYENQRIDGSVASSEDKSGSINIDNEQKVKNVANTAVPNYDSSCGRISESKENLHHDVPNSDIKPKALTIKSRRKTMPAESTPDVKCSSDEECYHPIAHVPEYPIKDNVDRNIRNRQQFNDKYSNKMTESSSIDDKASGYHESSRETYNSRISRHYDNDKHRSRDKYESSQRYRRHSPDRYNRRPARDYGIDSNQRLEYSRGRVLESPPNDKINYLRRHMGHRSNHERIKNNKNDRNTYDQDRYSGKHKIPCNRDEPFSKRKKTNSYNNHEDTNWYERELMEKQAIIDTFEQLESQYTSCQSPDYIHTDMSEPIKEIMNTALMQLEDPRITSKKYGLETYRDITSLSTINNMNIDLKIIDKSMWGIEKVFVPTALLQQPKENQHKQIYTSIENPLINMPMEINEIPYPPYECVNEYQSKDELKDQPIKSYSSNDYKKTSINRINNNKQSEKLEENMLNNLSVSKTTCSSTSIEYSVSKEKEYFNVIGNTEECYKYCDYKEKTKNSERKSSLKVIGNPNLNEGTESKNKTCFHDTMQSFEDKSYLSTMKGIEGDLELSDETSDNTDLQKINVNGSSDNKTTNDSCNSQDEKDMELKTHQKSNISKVKVSDRHIGTNLDNVKHKSDGKFHEAKIGIEDKVKIMNTKKVKSKKSQKSKDGVLSAENVEKINVTKKKTRTEKEKEKPNETKTKLQDMFGESSYNSLITPDDLGIMTPKPKKPATSYYTSIFEDTQSNLVTEKSGSNEVIDIMGSFNPKTDAITISTLEDKKSFTKNYKGNDEAVKCNNTTPKLSTIYENLKPLYKETDAVKTVIISTGVQPEEFDEKHVKNSSELTVQYRAPNTEETLVKALATSTPYKELTQHSSAFETISKIPVSICNSNDSRLGNDITNSDTLDSRNGTDVPDVRIFIRRKRKVLKKPLAT